MYQYLVACGLKTTIMLTLMITNSYRWILPELVINTNLLYKHHKFAMSCRLGETLKRVRFHSTLKRSKRQIKSS